MSAINDNPILYGISNRRGVVSRVKFEEEFVL
jgi:hypothetical protein